MSGKKKITWTEQEIADFKKLIINKRNILLDEIKLAKEKADEVIQNNSTNAIYSSHMADASSDQQEMEKNYYMMNRDSNYLQYLDRALSMIEMGTFGICTTCSELIDKERLEEVPHTSSCFGCKSKT